MKMAGRVKQSLMKAASFTMRVGVIVLAIMVFLIVIYILQEMMFRYDERAAQQAFVEEQNAIQLQLQKLEGIAENVSHEAFLRSQRLQAAQELLWGFVSAAVGGFWLIAHFLWIPVEQRRGDGTPSDMFLPISGIQWFGFIVSLGLVSFGLYSLLTLRNWYGLFDPEVFALSGVISDLVN